MTGGENGRGGEIPGCQRGSGTVLVAVVVMVVMAITAALIVVTGYVSAAHAVRGAADLVALSGAAGHARGRSDCADARRAAAANRVRLTSCTVEGDSWDFVVSVTVELRVGTPVPALPRTVAATAHAGRLGLVA